MLLVSGLFPATPHERHGYTVILPDGTGITGDAAQALVKRWTPHGLGTALLIAGAVIGLYVLGCAGLLALPQ